MPPGAATPLSPRPPRRAEPATALRPLALAGAAAFALLLHAGCAHAPPASPPPESGHERSVAVVYGKFQPEVALDVPAKGRLDGAVKGAGQGFLTWAAFPLRVGAETMRGCNTKECGYVAVGFLAIAAGAGTVGALVGGVHGAMHALPAEEARRIETATGYLAELNIQETMWSRALDAAMDHGGYRALPLPDGGPTASDCVADYSGLAAAGVDSVAEISVMSVGFMGEAWGRNPPLSVFLRVRVRRYQTADRQIGLAAEKEFTYRSRRRYFAEWMADGAAGVEEEFGRGYGVLAREIADWM